MGAICLSGSQGLSDGTDQKVGQCLKATGFLTHLHHGLERKLVQSLEGNLMIKPEMKMSILFDPVVPYPGIGPPDTFMSMCNRQVIQCPLFILARDGKQPKCHP